MRWVKALAAVTAMGALLVLPPILLLTYVGNPWPVGGLAWNAPLTDGAIIGVLAVIVWVLWAQLALCVAAEIVAAVRRRGDGAERVSFAFGFQRDFARWAVRSVLAAAVLGSSLGTTVANAAASPAEEPSSTTHQAVTQPNAPQVQASEAPVAEESQRQQTRTVTVGHLDNLYSIAQAHLGDGTRWTEIADLNMGAQMNDGSTFSDPEVIRTGWELKIPADKATGPGGVHVVEAGDSLSEIAHEELGDANQWPELYEANRGVVGADPNLIHPGQQLALPGTPAAEQAPAEEPVEEPAVPQQAEKPEAETAAPVEPPAAAEQDSNQGQLEGAGDVPPGAVDQAPDQESQVESPAADIAGAVDDVDEDAEGWPIRTTGGVGALLAAAVIGLIALRRSRQQRRRPPGAQMPLPGGDAEVVETEVRAVADPIGLDTVDIALRAVAAAAEDAGEKRPALRAARLTSEQLDLYLTEPAQLPAPWQATDDPVVWVLAAADAGGFVVDESAPAPYPALISLGHDEAEGVILLNLASVDSLALSGERARSALTAIALELGAAPWANAAEVTLVGAMAELTEALALRYVPALGNHDAEGSLLHEFINQPTSRQRVVLAASPLTAGQYAVLRDLGVAVVTQDHAESEWVLEVTDQDQAALQPLGLELTPQLVDATTYAGLLESLNVSLLDPREVAAEQAAVLPFGDAGDTSSEVETEQEAAEVLVDQAPMAGADEEEPAQVELEEAGDVPPAAELDQEEQQEEDQEEDEQEDQQQDQVDEEVPAEAPAVEDPVVDEPVAPAAAAVVEDEPEADAADTVHPLLQTGHPVLRMLGEKVDIIGASEAAPTSTTHRDVCTRIATYMALYPTASRKAMVNGVWGGRRIQGGTVDSRISNLRKWLGTHPETGEKYLPPRTTRLAGAVTTDWGHFTRLVGTDPASASTEDLELALSLVRGRPLEGENSRDYTFAEFELVDMYTLIADVAYQLARRRYYEGAWRKADQAATAGLLIEPAWEPLWRLRLHIAHSEGRPGTVAETIDRMHARISELAEDTLIELEPETVELIEALRAQDTHRIEQYREAL